MKALFVAGVALLAHATYAALAMQDELQAHHHGASDVSGAANLIRTVAGPTVGSSLPLWIVGEVLLGFVLALVGYVWRTSLHMIRLSDHQADMRYEHAVYTGSDFIHFNHRGSVVSCARP